MTTNRGENNTTASISSSQWNGSLTNVVESTLCARIGTILYRVGVTHRLLAEFIHDPLRISFEQKRNTSCKTRMAELDSCSTASSGAAADESRGPCRSITEGDGNEGDDERTSGQSIGEAGDLDVESVTEEKRAKDGKSVLPVVTAPLADANWKPLPIRKKHRRGSKRNNKPRKRYVPYAKLSWEEKKQRDERDTKRAFKLREQYTNAKGRPTAPYNTTQFLMAEHDLAEPDLGTHAHMQSDGEESTQLRTRVPSNSYDDSDFDDDYNESPEDEIYEQQFFEKDFTETYEQVHVENLHSMSKNDLVREFMLLEERVENMELKLKESEALNKVCARISGDATVVNGDRLISDHKRDVQTSNSITKEDILLLELNRLRKENERLLKENEEMKDHCLNCADAKVFK